MSNETIYLDHNSTTPILPEVASAISRCLAARYANPSSLHQPGRRARQALETARDEIAQLLGADPTTDRVVFTSGGTEANNLALLGLARGAPGTVVFSTIEHPSVVAAGLHRQRHEPAPRQVRVSANGVVDLEHLRQLVHKDTCLVSVMLGNNETGVLQPVSDIAAICHQFQVPLHTDAAQVVGKLPVHFRSLGVSAMTISAHKFHGPRGIGALIVRADSQLDPILHGGMQQWGIRPGTESVTLAVGMLCALQLWQREANDRRQRLQELRDCFEQEIRNHLPDIVVLGNSAPRLPHTSNISFPGLDRQALLMALDLAGIVCSTGSACASGSTEPSPVLVAMGCPEPVVRGALRFSLGATTTAVEIHRAARRIIQVVKDLRNKKSARFTPSASRGETP